ncbi:FliG C-terminal domain-containing protein [Ferrimonas lipolytica]|uniref:Flagellar motor switch protein FliG n=1 Tax=Ferrimonas lipolytica TaxID=2724191 RepID=A0A6H1UCH8_9GAMM|nr:FliG C-terminal domain-containing protein [Ferrimonas lipolytica]QIZ76807.1 flagellar motor switch protein FliG [Ferrimonas lipolytica]
MNDNQPRELDRVEQAAMILLSLPESQASQVMQRLPSVDIQKLTQTMASLRQVSNSNASSVLANFFDLYKKNAGIKKASRDLLGRILHDAVGQSASKSLIEQVYGYDVYDAVQRLEWVDDLLLADELAQEHHQMQANLLAMLTSKKSATVLALLPESSHDDLLYRIATMEKVNNAAVDEVEQLIERCILRSNQTKAPKVDGIKRVADIVNNFSGKQEVLLKTLREQDHNVAEQVESRMFDFAVLGRQKDDVLQSLVAQVEPQLLAMALKGANEGVRNAIMNALPKRMVQGLTSEMQALGSVPSSQAAAARTELMLKAKLMMEQGELELQLFEDQVVD